MKKENKKTLNNYGIFLIILFSILTGFLYLVACAIKGRWLLPQDGFASNTRVDATNESAGETIAAVDTPSDEADKLSDEADKPSDEEGKLDPDEIDGILRVLATPIEEAERLMLEAEIDLPNFAKGNVRGFLEVGSLTADALLLTHSFEKEVSSRCNSRKDEMEANTQRLLSMFDRAVSDRHEVVDPIIANLDATFSQKIHAQLDNRIFGERRIIEGQPEARGLNNDDCERIVVTICDQEQSSHSNPQYYCMMH
ncbi:MAG: hypothetical protein VXW87_04680 [Pseudomonadota bacterium]|nr:hypothetical protein [Pseudomonadota bacterium]